MGTIYLVNILHKILIYPKYTLCSVTIISRPFMLIIILEIHKIHLCIFIGLQLNWSHLQLMGHKLLFLDGTKLNVVHMGGWIPR